MIKFLLPLCFLLFCSVGECQVQKAALRDTKEAFRAIYGSPQVQPSRWNGEVNLAAKSKPRASALATDTYEQAKEKFKSNYDFRPWIGTLSKQGEIGMLIFPQQGTVFQVVNKSEMIVSIGPEKYWVSGLPTTGLIDGKPISLRRIWMVREPKSYRSTIGKRTIKHLSLNETLNWEQIRKELIAENPELCKEPNSEKIALRHIWTSKSGIEIRGKFVRRSTTSSYFKLNPDEKIGEPFKLKDDLAVIKTSELSKPDRDIIRKATSQKAKRQKGQNSNRK